MPKLTPWQRAQWRRFLGQRALWQLTVGLGAVLLCLSGADASPSDVTEAFADGPQLPWYDATQDTIRKVRLRPHSEPPSPQDWQRQEQAPREQTGFDWNWDLEWLWVVLQWSVWILLAVAAIYAIWLLIQAYLRGELRRSSGTRDVVSTSSAQADLQRLENLPVPLESDDADLLRAAERSYQAGRYSEAIVYLFSYQLIELDRHHLLQLVKGKTNRQYLRELADRQNLRFLIEQTMIAFEDAFFGARELGADRFEACWSEVDRFHRLLGDQV